MNITNWDKEWRVPNLIKTLRKLDLYSDRKMRLFAAHCCKRISNLIPDGNFIGVAEAYADAPLRYADALKSAARKARKVAKRLSDRSGVGDAIMRLVRQEDPVFVMAYESAARAEVVNIHGGHYQGVFHGPAITTWINVRKEQSKILKSLFGNPHKPWTPPNNPDVTNMAKATYHDLKAAPVLADALEEAGETDQEVLKHLRCDDLYRGDHVIDKILGWK